MSENLENHRSVFKSYHVKGEAVSFWVPLGLALLGVMNSVFIAHSLLSSDFNKIDFLPSSSKIGNQYGQQANKSTDNGERGLNNISPVAIKESIPDGPVTNSSRKMSETVNGFSKPQRFDDSEAVAEAQGFGLMSKEADATLLNSDVKPQSALRQDCPPLFFFAFSRDDETPQVRNLMPKIKRLKNWLRQHPETKVLIEGHTDSYGPEEYNLLLSYRRAKAAEQTLLKAGISKSQLITKAFGEQEPLQGHLTQSGKNRRAYIRIDALPECINTLINGDSN